jgi:hypothetical protein
LACDQKVEGSIPHISKKIHCNSVEKLGLSVGFLSFVRNKERGKIISPKCNYTGNK